MKLELGVGYTSANQSGPLQASTLMLTLGVVKALHKATNIVGVVHVKELWILYSGGRV